MDQDEKLEQTQEFIHKCRSILRDNKTTWGQFVTSRFEGLRMQQFGGFEFHPRFTSHLNRHCIMLRLGNGAMIAMKLDPIPTDWNPPDFWESVIVPEDEP